MQNILTQFAATCQGGGFLGFPTWYKYLDGEINPGGLCTPTITAIGDVWLIVAAAVEILIRLAALAAIALIIWGGISLIIAQGEPDKVKQAQRTIINALAGLVIAIAATAFVSFIAGRFN